VEAPPEIVGAIRYANRWRVGDLIITGRGGGSIEDLWAFNDERVARAIYESELPVISAVGHEPDVTISDYVADLRAATPSNAAELAVPDMAELLDSLDAVCSRMTSAEDKRIAALRDRLTDLASRRVMTSPGAYVDQKRMELDYVQTQLITAAQNKLAGKREEYVRLAAKLDALSPLKVLARGYSVATLENGEIVSKVSQTNPGDRLSISLSDGKLDCEVIGGKVNG
jgi:exodeoxyribonuclease VII large subunit